MPKILHLAGRRSGLLLVRELVPKEAGDRYARWLCDCDCGQVRVVRATDISRGAVRSCGCAVPATYDLTGRRFGMLVAVSVQPLAPHHQGRRWLCQCDCGRKSIARAKDLKDKDGNTTSCGCRINRLVVTKGETTPRQWVILEAIRDRGNLLLHQSILPDVLGIDPVSVWMNVKRLVDRGFVAKVRVPQGRHAPYVMLKLLPAGREHLAAYLAAYLAARSSATTAVPKEERAPN